VQILLCRLRLIEASYVCKYCHARGSQESSDTYPLGRLPKSRDVNLKTETPEELLQER
jgi:hypothetical protein